LIGDNPDVRALDLLRRASATQMVGTLATFEFPPMLSDGLFGLDRLEWSQSTKYFAPVAPLLRDSARLARLRALPEGPWTIFWHDANGLAQAAGASFTPRWKSADDSDFLRDSMRLYLSVNPGREITGNQSLPELQSKTTPFGERESSPFKLAEAEATIQANLSLTEYLASVRQPANILGSVKLKPEHLNWTGLAPASVTSVLASLQPRSILSGDRFEPFES
jgi:hypothetical protein